MGISPWYRSKALDEIYRFTRSKITKQPFWPVRDRVTEWEFLPGTVRKLSTRSIVLRSPELPKSINKCAFYSKKCLFTFVPPKKTFFIIFIGNTTFSNILMRKNLKYSRKANHKERKHISFFLSAKLSASFAYRLSLAQALLTAYR